MYSPIFIFEVLTVSLAPKPADPAFFLVWTSHHPVPVTTTNTRKQSD